MVLNTARTCAAVLALAACATEDQPTIYAEGAKTAGDDAAIIHCREHCRMIRNEADEVIAAAYNRQRCFMGCLTDVVVPPGIYTISVTECEYDRIGGPRIDIIFELQARPGLEYWIDYREIERGETYSCYLRPSIRNAEGRSLDVEWRRRF